MKKSRTKEIPDNTRKKTGKHKLPKKMAEKKWEPGQSGNPKGRPKGSRNKFAQAFVDDFLKDWEEHGPKVLRRARVEEPAAYLRVAASILPKELNVSVDDTALDELLESMDDDELENLLAGLAAVGAGSKNKKDTTKEKAGK